MTDTTETKTETAQDANGDVELFKLAAVRAPKLFLEDSRVIKVAGRRNIDVDGGEAVDGEGHADGNVLLSGDAVSGHLSALAVRIIAEDDEKQVLLGEFDLEIAGRNEAWESPEVSEWFKKKTGLNIDAIVAAEEWGKLKESVHRSLINALFPSGAESTRNLVLATAMLRACRLMALVETISRAPAPLSALDVQRFLHYATVQLPLEATPTNQNPLARPPAIADLTKVCLGSARYVPGPIAHIENVMASEKRERTHRIREENEETTTRETERSQETLKDLTTASNVEMQQEAVQALSSSTDIEAGLKASASYGPTVSIETDARLARHDSNESVTHAAASIANSVTQQAKQRVMDRIRETRTVRHLLETEETNLHGFDNSGPNTEHIVGIYRYVEQVQEAWMENYGKRVMLEFIVPEPAAIFQWAIASMTHAEDDPEPSKPNNPANAAEDLSPEHINENNYLQLVGLYGARGVKAPPQTSVDISVSFQPATRSDLFVFQDSKTLKVPSGYRAVSWAAQCVTWGDKGTPEHVWMVGVGESAQPQVNNDPDQLNKFLSGNISAEQDSTISVVMLGRGLIDMSASVRVHCDRTVDELNRWKLEVYDKVLSAWDVTHQDWMARKARADSLARGDAASSPLRGTSPEENRVVERRELRRSVIHMLLGDSQDKGKFAGRAVTRPDHDRPTLDLGIVAKERDDIQFFEQSFEWPDMTWVHYPYYWADTTQWADSIRRRENDPQWAAFLSAGATRVSVPVRPGFEAAICLYLATGVIWNGGQVPTVGDPAYLGIAEEIAESLGTGQVAPQKRPLDPVRLPTQLIRLQPTSELNPSIPLFAEPET
ncbi:hypothetical protein [Azospirillum canadense]|uniref:hypothetical protein n=1 Tax=Azospirillum canadense TaxID=403962 RepID=UPI0022277B39|nr:hypothetical protein [Azospirillum canadense]MCW2240699.1 hypothetical protein [Azospirillum canadense]